MENLNNKENNNKSKQNKMNEQSSTTPKLLYGIPFWVEGVIVYKSELRKVGINQSPKIKLDILIERNSKNFTYEAVAYGNLAVKIDKTLNVNQKVMGEGRGTYNSYVFPVDYYLTLDSCYSEDVHDGKMNLSSMFKSSEIFDNN